MVKGLLSGFSGGSISGKVRLGRYGLFHPQDIQSGFNI
jgi:hypothetical protein